MGTELVEVNVRTPFDQNTAAIVHGGISHWIEEVEDTDRADVFALDGLVSKWSRGELSRSWGDYERRHGYSATARSRWVDLDAGPEAAEQQLEIRTWGIGILDSPINTALSRIDKGTLNTEEAERAVIVALARKANYPSFGTSLEVRTLVPKSKSHPFGVAHGAEFRLEWSGSVHGDGKVHDTYTRKIPIQATIVDLAQMRRRFIALAK